MWSSWVPAQGLSQAVVKDLTPLEVHRDGALPRPHMVLGGFGPSGLLVGGSTSCQVGQQKTSCQPQPASEWEAVQITPSVFL